MERKKSDKEIQRIEAKIRAEEDIQRIEEEAYRLWKADGRPKGKEDDYRRLAIHKIKGENIPTIYKPYYLLEKRVLEPTDAWISKQAFFTILGRLGNLALIAAVIAFIFGEDVRRNNEIFTAWQTITSANGQPGSGGRIEALEFLNSRPWRFPWIGITKKGLYWDKQEKRCKLKRLFGRRWTREPLVGLSAPKAYLVGINLCGALLNGANLQNTNLYEANLQGAFLTRTNLQLANLYGANLQRAFLGEANLHGAFLDEANLQNAILIRANLQHAFLFDANLQDAFLYGANLQDAILTDTQNLTSTQIKNSCNWDKAIYKGEYISEKETYVATPDNTNYIEELKKDKSSDPKEPVDCSHWEK